MCIPNEEVHAKYRVHGAGKAMVALSELISEKERLSNQENNERGGEHQPQGRGGRGERP